MEEKDNKNINKDIEGPKSQDVDTGDGKEAEDLQKGNIDYKALYEKEKSLALKAKVDRDAALSKAAAVSKELKAKMSAEEQAKAEAAEAAAETERLLKEYQDKEALATYRAAWLGVEGFSAEMAAEAAEALHTGDYTKVIELVGDHQVARDKRNEKARLNDMQNNQDGGKKVTTDPFELIEQKYNRTRRN